MQKAIFINYMVNSLRTADKVLYMFLCSHQKEQQKMVLGLMHGIKPFKKSKSNVTHHSLMQIHANQIATPFADPFNNFTREGSLALSIVCMYINIMDV